MDVSDITGSGYDVVKQVPVLRPGMHPGSLSLVALLNKMRKMCSIGAQEK